MNTKNILLITSITFMFAHNMEAMHRKAIKPLSMRYVRGLKSYILDPIARYTIFSFLISGTVGSMVGMVTREYMVRKDREFNLALELDKLHAKE